MQRSIVNARLALFDVAIAVALALQLLASVEAELDSEGALPSVVDAPSLCVSATNFGVCDSIMAVWEAEVSTSWDAACSLPARDESDDPSV
jgi:hypothetical protein